MQFFVQSVKTTAKTATPPKPSINQLRMVLYSHAKLFSTVSTYENVHMVSMHGMGSAYRRLGAITAGGGPGYSSMGFDLAMHVPVLSVSVYSNSLLQCIEHASSNQ